MALMESQKSVAVVYFDTARAKGFSSFDLLSFHLPSTAKTPHTAGLEVASKYLNLGQSAVTRKMKDMTERDTLNTYDLTFLRNRMDAVFAEPRLRENYLKLYRLYNEFFM